MTVPAEGGFAVPLPRNEPVQGYAPGSPERAALAERVAELRKDPVEALLRIGSRDVGTGSTFEVRAPARPRPAPGRGARRRTPARRGRDRRRARRRARLGRHPVQRARRDPAARRRPAGGPVARHAQRRDDPRAVQVGAAGRDRRRLRAGRLLALQRRLRRADPRDAARVVAGHVEPHRPPPPRGLRAGDEPVQLHRDRREPLDGARRSWATSWSGSRRRRRRSARTSRWRCCARRGCPTAWSTSCTATVRWSSTSRCRIAGVRGPALHGLGRGLPRPVAHGRPADGRLPHVSRAWSARRAARTSWSRTPRRTSRRWWSRWAAARSSTRARSARRRRARTCRGRCGRRCATGWPTSRGRSRSATSATSRRSSGR